MIRKLSYTISVSIIYIIYRFILLTQFDVINEFFFVIGTVNVISLFFIKELPVLYLTRYKDLGIRLSFYACSGFMTSLFFALFYLSLSELEIAQFGKVVLLSLELHLTAVILYFVPIELYRVWNRKESVSA